MIIGLSHLFLLSIYHVLAAAAVADGGGGRVLPSAQDRSLRILAVGDSLTAGFIFRDGKYEFHPYTRKMMDLCKVCTIENIGVTGNVFCA